MSGFRETEAAFLHTFELDNTAQGRIVDLLMDAFNKKQPRLTLALLVIDKNEDAREPTKTNSKLYRERDDLQEMISKLADGVTLKHDVITLETLSVRLAHCDDDYHFLSAVFSYLRSIFLFPTIWYRESRITVKQVFEKTWFDRFCETLGIDTGVVTTKDVLIESYAIVVDAPYVQTMRTAKELALACLKVTSSEEVSYDVLSAKSAHSTVRTSSQAASASASETLSTSSSPNIAGKKNVSRSDLASSSSSSSSFASSSSSTSPSSSELPLIKPQQEPAVEDAQKRAPPTKKNSFVRVLTHRRSRSASSTSHSEDSK